MTQGVVTFYIEGFSHFVTFMGGMQNRGEAVKANLCGNGKHVFFVWSSDKLINRQKISDQPLSPPQIMYGNYCRI
ncbi:hypothetical protein A1359_20220 [Methylomonas lenta]|uniref:Uncharacterized protein n=1 Tax=Methylomonas lenta TaxID=980561 RepID=A0A177NUE5_9GAMM|nr:hypothetical protein A1359_20220 [Methylomonas lenta]